MKFILKYRFLLWFFFLCLLYAGCTVGLWDFLNSSYVFLDVQRIIQGNSVQYCSSPSQLRSPSAITVKGERCSLRASQLPVSWPHYTSGRNGSWKSLTAEVPGKTAGTLWPAVSGAWACECFTSLPLMWCNQGGAAPEASRTMASGNAHLMIPSYRAGLGCHKMGLLQWLCPASLCLALLRYFGAFFSPKIRSEKHKGPWKWRPEWKENISMGFRGNCCSTWEHSCQSNRNEPFIWDFRQNGSRLLGPVQLLLLSIHNCMHLTLQKGFHQPMGKRLWSHWDFKHKAKSYTYTSPTVHLHKQISEWRGEDEWKW